MGPLVKGTMSWLETAREQGKYKARHTERTVRSAPKLSYSDKSTSTVNRPTEAFHKEEVTEESLTAFLRNYLGPIVAVLHDLRQFSSDGEDKDFIIEEPEYTFMYLGDLDRIDHLESYSLFKHQNSYRGLTDYRVVEAHAFGCRIPVNHWTQENLINLKLFPHANAHTHYFGVEYKAGNYSKLIEAEADSTPVIADLQSVIGVVYAEYIEKQARYFGW